MDGFADSAQQLQRTAGWFQQRASDSDAVTVLPAALAHMEEALDHLSTAMVKAAQAVEDSADQPGALSPTASALQWHLFRVSSLLRGAGDACPDTRRWARALLAERDPSENAATACRCARTPMRAAATR